MPNPVGRPSIYTQELADEICKRIAGGESLRSICNGPPRWDELVDEDRHSHMPDIHTILRWAVNTDHEFCAQYENARQAQSEKYAEEIVTLSDDCDGGSSSRVAKARLQTDNRKWVSSRLLSRRYGTRTAVEVSDPGGESFGTAATTQLANLLAAAFVKKESDDDDDSLA